MARVKRMQISPAPDIEVADARQLKSDDDQLQQQLATPSISAGGDSDASAGDASEHQQRQNGGSEQQQEPKRKRPKGMNKLSEEKLKRLKQRYNRRGIVYISRIPPHMKPQKLKHMLSQHGEVGRVYLTPEDPAMRKQRKREGRNSGKNFTEGWVEFEDKADAKMAAELLNGNPMGGKRRSAFHFDLWNIKYLPRFKWEHLTEEIAYERAVREQKLAAELRVAKRERDFYLQQVGRAKAADAIEARKRKRLQQQPPAQGEAGGTATQQGPGSGSGGASAEQQQPRIRRKYGQRAAKQDPGAEGATTLPLDMLELIGGRRKADGGGGGNEH